MSKAMTDERLAEIEERHPSLPQGTARNCRLVCVRDMEAPCEVQGLLAEVYRLRASHESNGLAAPGPRLCVKGEALLRAWLKGKAPDLTLVELGALVEQALDDLAAGRAPHGPSLA